MSPLVFDWDVKATASAASVVANLGAGQEGAILRFVFWHSLVLAALMGLLVMLRLISGPAAKRLQGSSFLQEPTGLTNQRSSIPEH